MIDDAVDIVLDKPRRLKFTSNSIVRLERALETKTRILLARLQKALFVAGDVLGRVGGETGDPETLRKKLEKLPENELTKLNERLLDSDLNFSTEEVRAFLWAGLFHEAPELTIEDAGDLLDGAPGDTMTEQEQYVFNRAMVAFLLRTAPRSQKAQVRQMGRTLLESEKLSSGATGQPSDEKPSGADSESENSGA